MSSFSTLLRRVRRGPGRRFRALVVFAGVLSALAASAATYQAGSDVDLARRAPIVVRATVVSEEARLEAVDGAPSPFTYVTLATLETIKGRIPEAFSVRLPGGRVGDVRRWVPGTPVFAAGGEVVLFLERAPGHPGAYRLTELGLSKFDLVRDGDDSAGRTFARRLAFDASEDLELADRADVNARLDEKSAVPARDAASFLSALRAIAQGRPAGDIDWKEPANRLEPPSRRPKWANIGGREPGDCGGGDPCLFRWYWDTTSSPSPTGAVVVTGTQTNLTNDDATGCGTDSLCDVQHAVDEWDNVAGTDVRYTGPSATGNVRVFLDATTDYNGGSSWTTPLGCGAGVIGLGGPSNATGPRTYRGDGDYYATLEADVSMRKVDCATGYSARTFKTAVMHELGHTLGLGHPNQETSIHSTTPSSAWDVAVMRSSVPPSKPEVPQADDIQAIQYYYTTGSLGTLPTASFSFAPSAPVAGVAVAFTDASTGGAVGWNWTFGDPASADNTSTDRNPSHVYTSPGTYTVTLVAGSASGSGTTSKTVTVGQGTAGCVPTTTTLCLNDNRFAVTAAYRTNDPRSGNGIGTELTADSGYFYFFNPANIEVVVKVLNACSVNGAYWVFAAGLTNVEVTLTVRDTLTGAAPKVYFNPLGTAFQPVQDTSAFATCP